MLNIYLTDLAAYNSGYLIGKWISLPMDSNELQEQIKEVLTLGEAETKESHEEWFITDYEWQNIDLWSIEEYEDIFELNDNLDLLKDCSTTQLKAIRFLLTEQITLDVEDAFYRSDDVIIHESTSMEDIAYELMQESYGVDKLPTIISNNIDYYSIGQDLELDGNYTVIDADVYEYIG